MAGKEVAPQLGLDSFSCAHCGALAHQHWFEVYVSSFEKGTKPFVFTKEDFRKLDLREMDEPEKKRARGLSKRFLKNEVTYEVKPYGQSCNWEMLNVSMSMCHSCDAFSVWIKDKLAWPSYSIEIEPHPDIPGDIKDDFIEAAEIVEKSPRGSAALSRLMVQKLMSHLGGEGKDINANIASLVKKGLEPEIQMALDIVRVTGNNAVHPGELALKEDVGTARALLQLINLVVERRIATQKRIEEMFGNLPQGALEAIEKRDAPKAIEDKSGTKEQGG
jgi:hypothetical protein